MEERTLKIISVCKGKSKIPKKSQRYNSKLDAIVDYMSDECDCPIEYYDDNIILQIIENASEDYLRTCNYPHTFLYSYFNALQTAKNLPHKPLKVFVHEKDTVFETEQFMGYTTKELAEALCSALAQVQVMDNGKYINGFCENDLKPVYPYEGN